MLKQFYMEAHFQWLLDRARSFTAASTAILRQGLWLTLLLLSWTSAAQSAISCSTVNSPAISNLPDRLNIQSADISISGNMLTAKMYLKQLPATVQLNPPTVPLNNKVYHWGIDIDVDNNQATGGSGTWLGFEYSLATSHFKSSTTSSIVSFGSGFQNNVWANGANGTSSSVGSATLASSTADNSITLTGNIPGISNSSRFRLVAYEFGAISGNQYAFFTLPCQTVVISPPTCTLTATPPAIAPGGSSLLTASCSPAATSYAWTGGACVGATAASAACSASADASGYVNPLETTTYTVTGMNAGGTGNTASATVTVNQGNHLLTVANSGGGIVTSSTGSINCGATCSGNFSGGASVTLIATPVSGNIFSGWSGDCTGAGACVVTMTAARNVTATFKPKPFVANTTSNITATSATATTTINFNASDVGRQGAVYVTAWVPANGLSTMGILTATLSKAMSVTTVSDNPDDLAGETNIRQVPLGNILANDPNAFVLIQLTSSGWQLVQNGVLTPYTVGMLSEFQSKVNLLNSANPSNLLGAQFCVGYGTSLADVTSAAEMIAAGRMQTVLVIPDPTSTVTTSGSCNVAASAAIQVAEFYNTNLDNYFITADPNEALAIDNGMAGPGWSRTGNTFKSGGTTSVCRFYGSYSPGPNSHFYTVNSSECQGLKDQQIPAGDPRKLTVKSWTFESLDFVSTPPTTGGVNGACPAGTAPVYRAYNNGYARGVDSNHRITGSLTAIQQVVNRGWSNEGVVMCAPN